MQTLERLEGESVEEYCDSLQGTCQGLDFDAFTQKELEELDNLIFECFVCGWWCEQGDYNSEACQATGENVCSECECEEE